jgi:Restriction endonuclease NotI
MSVDPTTLIAEVLGRPAIKGYDPAKDGYTCPFTNDRCVKASGREPMPVCSVWRGGRVVIVCPNRFSERDLIDDVLDHCWPDGVSRDVKVAPEVQLAGFGNVDFVVAHVDEGKVGHFVSVEAQAVDVTGSYRPAYAALLNGDDLERAPSFGLNWDNVYKRYMTQVIRKGFHHHHWRTKIVALMQDELYFQIQKYPFLTSRDISDPSVNVVFLLYSLSKDWTLGVSDVIGTSHANLSQAALYADAPDRKAFEAKILDRLRP